MVEFEWDEAKNRANIAKHGIARYALSRRGSPIARKGSATMKKYTEPLTADDAAKLPDGEIDYSDIPELDEEFWQNAELVLPPSKERITLRLDREVLAYFRRSGSGYQTRINAVLRAYVQIQQGKNAQR
jgi:uncharacterized protein (DUF4415 family)